MQNIQLLDIGSSIARRRQIQREAATMENKKCACSECSSGTHGQARDGKPSECLARYSDAPMLWQDGICPGCINARRSKPVKSKSPPHKVFFGKGASIDDIVDTIIALPDGAEKQ